MQKIIIILENDDSFIIEKPCIFLGAGVSKLSGYPNWQDLAYKLIDRFWKRRQEIKEKGKAYTNSDCEALRESINKNNIVNVFTYLEDLNKGIYIEELKKIFNECEEKEDKKIFASIKMFSEFVDFFITTNIDRGLEKYLGLEEKYISIVSGSDTFRNLEDINGKKIYYLHGRIDKPETWVFTREQYDSNHFKPGYCTSFLEYVFENFNVIFIGYGLKEIEVLKNLIGSNQKHYRVEPTYDKRNDDLKIEATIGKNTYNIELIPYNVEEKGEEYLVEFLDKIYKDSKEEARDAK